MRTLASFLSPDAFAQTMIYFAKRRAVLVERGEIVLPQPSWYDDVKWSKLERLNPGCQRLRYHLNLWDGISVGGSIDITDEFIHQTRGDGIEHAKRNALHELEKELRAFRGAPEIARCP